MVFLVHHGEAVGPDVDPRRPLSEAGRVSRRASGHRRRRPRRQASRRLAQRQASRETDRRRILAALQRPRTNFQRRKICSLMTRRTGCSIACDGETRDILIAGHFHHLPRLHALMLKTDEVSGAVSVARRRGAGNARRRGTVVGTMEIGIVLTSAAE